MRRAIGLAILICGSMFAVAPLHAVPAPDDLVKKLAPPMTAVAVLLVREQWDSKFDELVQGAPSAAVLGAKWTSSLPAWQKARGGIAAREDRIYDAYGKSPELATNLRAALDKYFAGPDAAALTAALNGPGGPRIIRFQASSEFAVTTMGEDRNGPTPGDPRWIELLSSLRKRFNERIGAAVPADDPVHIADVQAFVAAPAARQFQQLWMTVVAKAKNTLSTGMNLMVFDNREAISREIDAAVASVK